MKKVLFILIPGIAFLLSIGSCTKEKDCECTTSYPVDTIVNIPDIITNFKIKEGDCSEANRYDSSGLIVHFDCVEK